MFDAMFVMMAFGIIGTIVSGILVFFGFDQFRSMTPMVVGVASIIVLIAIGFCALFISWDQESKVVETFEEYKLISLNDAGFSADETNGKYILEKHDDKKHCYAVAIPLADGSIVARMIEIDARRASVEKLEKGEEPYIEFRHAERSSQKMFGHRSQDYTETEFIIHVSEDQIVEAGDFVNWNQIRFEKSYN